MKIFIVNGSPRGTNGYTHKLIELFAEGAREAGASVTIEQLAQKKIHQCTGELACWTKTPGECIHKDDMAQLLPQMTEADGVVFASPVYVDGMTGLLKNFLDRCVPMAQPFFEMRDGHIRHPSRHGSPQRMALISVCGFIEMDNFDPIVNHIEAICKNFNSEYAGAVLFPAAPAWDAVKFLHPFKFRKVKAAIRTAGEQFVQSGSIDEETAKVIAQPLFTAEQYVDAANKEFKKKIDKLG
jgi:putative NADPH-quinone reductase